MGLKVLNQDYELTQSPTSLNYFNQNVIFPMWNAKPTSTPIQIQYLED